MKLFFHPCVVKLFHILILMHNRSYFYLTQALLMRGVQTGVLPVGQYINSSTSGITCTLLWIKESEKQNFFAFLGCVCLGGNFRRGGFWSAYANVLVLKLDEEEVKNILIPSKTLQNPLPNPFFEFFQFVKLKKCTKERALEGFGGF